MQGGRVGDRARVTGHGWCFLPSGTAAPADGVRRMRYEGDSRLPPLQHPPLTGHSTLPEGDTPPPFRRPAGRGVSARRMLV
ncbi:hypothetical protein GCM10010236_35130 [Streptomyces eurythermus]|nr:hypothetical protein GCM10010236_35130 [Streptomyces eurythermus]